MSKEKMTLVQRIMAILELSDSGKISKFFAREIKAAERAIEKLEANKKSLKLQFTCEESDLIDAIEDAKDAIEDAKTQIVPEDLANNHAMVAFADIYWSRINSAKGELKKLEDSLAYKKESNKQAIEEIESQIAAYKERIAICKE
ncbi:hypothetical protein [Tenacibaculum sp.]|uniref:hypothetical protein n=1 Tax=Tenacibaculum sp. TaxID=1906242 RepID=UPI003D0B3F99